MVVYIKHLQGGGGPTVRPQPKMGDVGVGTGPIIANRHAQVTPEVGPPTYPIESVASRRQANMLQSGPTRPGTELVLGTDIQVPSTDNAAFVYGAPVMGYEGPMVIAGNATFGRGEADQYGGMSVPAWYPTYPMGVEPEDRS